MKKLVMLVVIFFIGLISIAISAESENNFDVIEMKNSQAFENHRMEVVKFSHMKHIEDYGYSCGECHHDENGNELNDITYNDDIKSCFSCHNKKERPDRNMSNDEKREYYFDIIHQNCIDCHKNYNEEINEKIVPIRCMECHKKN